ncbi:unnamed protein product [Callosobruchus maculatus]|uniref:Uncharacterized protein n=1 Tax=Callosobruchus maculatus TaxID=64391 RepID=A0A653DXF6_CALMS|nr:unnamed protein product [Callosobruchus maculatus]
MQRVLLNRRVCPECETLQNRHTKYCELTIEPSSLV